MPHFRLERAGGGRVAGVDEAGRGPLAGPVVAAAVVFARPLPRRLAALIDDSKKLTPAARALAYDALRSCGIAEIRIGAASVAEIDRLNILRASLLAMARALSRLSHPPDLALIDGNTARGLEAWNTRCVVDGDALSLSIAAASIVAKVTRDRAMTRLASRCPGYGWERNAGYATGPHRDGLRRLGPSAHHRRSFGTVRLLLGAVEAAPDCPVAAE